MLTKDRLHTVAMIITSMAMLSHFVGILYPDWFTLKQYKRTITTFGLFGHVRCSDTICYPEDLTIVPVPRGRNPPQGLTGENADWLLAGRWMCVFCSISMLATVVLQLVFILLRNFRSLQIIANSFLIFTALFDFIASIIFMSKIFTLSQVYVETRTIGALFANTIPAGFLLFASLMCVVAAVLTTLGFKPPVKDPRFL